MDRLGWNIEKYYSSEVDEYAIEISTKNWPDIIHLGSVTELYYKEKTGGLYYWQGGSTFAGHIDVLIGGSPCQDLSGANLNGKGLKGTKSSLFFEYSRLLQETKPKYFLFENVASMKKDDKDEITATL